MTTLLATILAAIVTVSEVPKPTPRGWVTDLAGILSPQAEQRLNAAIDGIERDLGVEIAIATVDDVAETPKDFATALFARWGIGEAGSDNGLLILVVKDKRRTEIETGYGLEGSLPDGWLGVMQTRAMVPHFKAGDFDGGMLAALGEIEQKLRGGSSLPEPVYGSGVPPYSGSPYQGAYLPPPAYSPPAPPRDRSGELIAAILAALGVIGFGVGGALLYRHRRRCPSCRIQMNQLDELADDAYLTHAQRVEEQLGSVDHDVYLCPGCGFTRLISSSRWFSGYSRCAGCGVRARQSSSRTITHATYDHGGLVQVNEHCRHCGYSNSYTRHTPRKTRPSSSSSSYSSRSSSSSSRGSSRSFGGGRSGGGGAGSSW